jgi:hypothetical protein
MVARLGEHPAQHVVLESLAEIVWQAQRDGESPDAAAYLQMLQQAAQG